MNKDRILEILESAKDKNDDVPMNLVRKAFDQLPSAEPDLQPTCNQLATDCISRQAAIDAYGDWYVEEGTEEGFIGTVKQLLEGLPSAQPESETGTWIWKHYVWWCSECGKNPTKGMGYVPRAEELFDYCPHCGKKMEGVQV